MGMRRDAGVRVGYMARIGRARLQAGVAAARVDGSDIGTTIQAQGLSFIDFLHPANPSTWAYRDGMPFFIATRGQESPTEEVIGMGNNRKSRRENIRLHCKPKKSYGNQMAAMNAGIRTGLNWYRCPYCKKWHLTKRNAPRC